jgi:hypothetical protein
LIKKLKDENMTQGMAQCAAQMYGAKLYNEAEGKPIAVIYGCATTGIEWRFLCLENNTLYHRQQYLFRFEDYSDDLAPHYQILFELKGIIG